jgi:hypothetical protein
VLLAVRDYIREANFVSSEQVARAFSMDLQALEPLVSLWVEKGVIKRVTNRTACATHCTTCGVLIYYQFIVE